MFVHGEGAKMKVLAKLIEDQMKLSVYCPENFQLIRIETNRESQLLTRMHLDESEILRLQ